MRRTSSNTNTAESAPAPAPEELEEEDSEGKRVKGGRRKRSRHASLLDVAVVSGRGRSSLDATESCIRVANDGVLEDDDNWEEADAVEGDAGEAEAEREAEAEDDDEDGVNEGPLPSCSGVPTRAAAAAVEGAVSECEDLGGFVSVVWSMGM